MSFRFPCENSHAQINSVSCYTTTSAMILYHKCVAEGKIFFKSLWKVVKLWPMQTLLYLTLMSRKTKQKTEMSSTWENSSAQLIVRILLIFIQTNIWSKSKIETLEKILTYVQGLKKKTRPERTPWFCSGIFSGNFEHISLLFLVFLSLNLRIDLFT